MVERSPRPYFWDSRQMLLPAGSVAQQAHPNRSSTRKPAMQEGRYCTGLLISTATVF